MCYNITSTVIKGCCHCIMNTQQCLNADVETVRKKSIKKKTHQFSYIQCIIQVLT